MPVQVGKIIEGTVAGITNFGAFIDLGEGKTGLVHISEVADDYVKDIREFIKDKQKVKVKVLSINDDGKISLSIRQAQEKKKSTAPTELDWSSPSKTSQTESLEDKISKFMKDSEEKMQGNKNRVKQVRRNTGGGSRE
ncbi:S1 domain-containing RNA-binding protein [Tindallia californiensis]|uniref:S1 RNA binding domain protein n=1 Tax=Tindallia californiensis TaxID=159292 RepID=A0A1H3PGK0_9FIRM|nr:S1 domain-containing RNA-binding protein [Tindallia californiensis]SDY99935.1 S1 RNA binding domain protein [Tindallia californiensis]